MVIKPGEKYTFTADRSIHISKAVIDFTSPSITHLTVTSLLVDYDDKKGIILCNLMGCDSSYRYKGNKAEADLDIYFPAFQRITFHSEKLHPDGQGLPCGKPSLPRIHLSGYTFTA
jgi:transcription elongation factor Elf1